MIVSVIAFSFCKITHVILETPKLAVGGSWELLNSA